MNAPVKNRWTLCLMSIMLVSSAVVFSVSGDAPQTLFLVITGLIGTFIVRRPLERTTRSFIYAGLTALVAVVFSEQIFPVDPRRFFLMPAELYCPAILLLGVAATYFDHRDSNVTGVIAMSIIGMMLAGNVVSFFGEFERMPLPPLDMGHFHVFYGVMVALQVTAMLGLLPRAQHLFTGNNRPNAHMMRRVLICVASLLVMCIAVLGLRVTASYYERKYQNLFSDLFQKYLNRRMRRVVFGRDVDLWRTVPLRSAMDKHVVLRAISSTPPGYLRGYAYSTYLQGRWSGFSEMLSLQMRPPEGRLAYSTFRRPVRPQSLSQSLRTERVDILPSKDFRSDVLLVPGSAMAFELVAAGLSESVDGVLTPTEWEQDTGYVYTNRVSAGGSAYDRPTLSPADRETYLRLPLSLRPDMTALAQKVFADSAGPGAEWHALAGLQRYFGDGFEYQLGVKMASDGGDPVVQFLRDYKVGHCELFAAASVLLLRSAGIPARYVTGFVCYEQNPNGGYWIARLQDAHAWAEAYIEGERRWVTVEMTPPAGIPDGNREHDIFSGFKDRFTTSWRRLMSLLKRGYVAEGIMRGLNVVWAFIKLLFITPLSGVLTILVLSFCGYTLKIYSWHRRSARDRQIGGERERLRESFLHLEEFLKKRGLVRASHATIHEFAHDLSNRKESVPEELAHLPDLLLDYADLRFRGEDPEQSAVDEFCIGVRLLTKPRLARLFKRR